MSNVSIIVFSMIALCCLCRFLCFFVVKILLFLCYFFYMIFAIIVFYIYSYIDTSIIVFIYLSTFYSLYPHL